MAKSEFLLAFNEIAELRKLPRDVITEALRQALISAYRRDTKASNAQRVEAEIDLVTNLHKIFVEKEVVDDVIDDNTEVTFNKARYIDPDIQMGDMLMVPIEYDVKRFGRIAAQTAKQVISQKIRDAERNQLYDEFKNREGELATGQIQSINNQQITLTLDRAEAIMPRKDQIPGERYRPHDKIRVLISEVKKSTRDPQIIVSRAHKNMLRRLLEYEVPEIYNKQVEIKSIAREAGHRSKVAVAAMAPGVDPLGACVGMRGTRIQNIVKELNEEKIDVIPWDADHSVFIAKALSPARVSGVYLEDDIDQGRTAIVIVPDDQLSLAIGREGQNARLAAKLTGWRIDIKSVSEAAIGAIDQIETPPLDKLAEDYPDMIVEVRRILDKKRADRAVMPEEYTTLSRFVQMVEQRQLDAREAGRSQRKKAMEKVRGTVPAYAFTVMIKELNLPGPIVQALKNVENVGELMIREQADAEKLQSILSAAQLDEDAIDVIHDALIDFKNAHRKKAAAETALSAQAAKSQLVVEDEEPVLDLLPAKPITAKPGNLLVVDDEDEEDAPPAFIDDMPLLPSKPDENRPKMRKVPKVAAEPVEAVDEPVFPSSGGDDEDDDEKKAEKKAKDRRRELVFDEDRGQVVAKRKRKGGRDRAAWEEDEDE